MTRENQSEMWQVEVGGQIYEAALGELPEWIGEGSLQPQDKVRKGNLRWIEARKVPALIPFFNASANGEPMPIVQTYTESAEPAGEKQQPHVSQTSEVFGPRTAAPSPYVPIPNSVAANGEGCSVHADTASFYACGSCGASFCKACPKSFGPEVKICPNCDSLCKPIGQVAEANRMAIASAAAMNEGFGMTDFFRAVAYPFKFKPSLIFGALMFMFFSLGQSASAVGGIFFFAASIMCVMLANMLTFGILANTVQNFTQGRLDADFMPSFDDFSIWDDVIHPFFLWIGACLSSFGPFVVVAMIGAYLIFSAATEQMKKFQSGMSRVPGTEFYKPDRTAEQSQQVKDLLDKVKQHNDRLAAQRQQQIEAADSGENPVNAVPSGNSEDEFADFEKMLQETRASQIEAIAPVGSGDPEEQYKQMFSGILRLAAPLVVIGAIAFLWGLFHFPAACAVAGYSRSFMATINPLVGIDTIKRLGLSYVKILLMALCLLIASGVISAILAIVLSPFALPRMGNIPANAVGSLFTFYFSVVFSCIVGFALFKAADRLKLYR